MSAFLSMFFYAKSVTYMPTVNTLRNLKRKEKLYKVNDRDKLYAAATNAGSISFRYSRSIRGRQEIITFGRYGVGGIVTRPAAYQSQELAAMMPGPNGEIEKEYALFNPASFRSSSRFSRRGAKRLAD